MEKKIMLLLPCRTGTVEPHRPRLDGMGRCMACGKHSDDHQ